MTVAPWLSEAELVKMTGKTKPSAQARALDAMGVPYRRRLDGKLIVGRAALERTLTMPAKPLTSSGLAF